MEVAVKEGKYIYCIIKSNQSENFGPLGIGVRNDELHTICFDDIAAVVSNSPIIKYPVSRDNMLAHERAIEEAMKSHTVLPVRFCTIAEDEEKIIKILEKEYNKFKDLLDEIKGKKELGLKAIFSASATGRSACGGKGGPASGGKEDIYIDILEKYKDIKVLKEKLTGQPPAKTYYQRMEIGGMVEAALQKEKEIYKEDILSALSSLAVEIKLNNNYGERMIINAAFLIEEDKEAEFDQKIQELDVKYGNKVKFKYVGTLPPFNFVNLVIETGKY